MQNNQRNSDESFDASFYLEMYPDVAQTSLSPYEHYQKYGKLLGRAKNQKDASDSNKTISPFFSDSFNKARELSLVYSSGAIIQEKLNRCPRVSLIVTNFNNGKYIAQALNSALSQKFVDLEIIVVDDGSSDNSLRVLKEFEHYDNVRIVTLLRNFGCYYARNIGLSLSTRDYISFLDSDDIMHPERLSLQVAAMSDESIMLSTSKMRRWSENYEAPLGDFKDGEITAVFKRKAFEKIGFFDTVRYGADEEYRKRLDRVFGVSSIKRLDKELYYARTVSTSLTTSGKNAIFTIDSGELKFKKAESRSVYAGNFRKWHKSFKYKNDKSGLYLNFPQTQRPFDILDKKQIASPCLNQAVIGCMATFPARQDVLKKTIISILPQLDELHIYLNDYDKIPEFLKHPKIKCYLSSAEVGDLRDNGKFYKLSKLEGYIFTLDDDIYYPSDYVRWMIHYLELFNRSVVSGVHGVIYPEEKKGYMQDRTVLHFGDEAKGTVVDSLGTGTVAFHSSLVTFDLNEFKTKGVCDLWFAKACHLKNIPLLAVPRKAEWLKPANFEGVNLFSEAKEKKKFHDELYHENLYPVIKGKGGRDCHQKLISSLYSKSSLHYAGFEFDTDFGSESDVQGYRPFTINLVDCPKAEINKKLPHLYVVVNGWNCAEYVSSCVSSLAQQQLGGYEVEFVFVDDGSSDDTLEKLLETPLLPNAKIVRNSKNMGPAFTRDSIIRNIDDPDAIVVLVDLDDELFNHSLKTVSQAYHDNPNCLMTLGNWENQNGKRNPLPFYDAEVIDSQTVRKIEKFHAAPLRTFKRKLYDVISEDDLKGPEGEWLQTCTDVAIMYPLLEQCHSENVVFFEKSLYMYNEKTSFGTLSRFGKPYKNERLEWLKKKPVKKRLISKV